MKKIFLSTISLCLFLLSNAQSNDIDIAKALITKNANEIAFTPTDLANYKISSTYSDAGIRYIYTIQTLDGILVRNQMRIFSFRNDKLLSSSGNFIQNLKLLIGNKTAIPSIKPLDAVRAAFAEEKLLKTPLIFNLKYFGNDQTEFDFGKTPDVYENILGKLMWLPINDSRGKISNIELVWEIVVAPIGSDDIWQVFVNAKTGNILGKENLTVYEINSKNNSKVASAIPELLKKNIQEENAKEKNDIQPEVVLNASYLVIPYPLEAPSFGPPAVRSNPWELAGAAGTLGWHSDGTNDYIITRGNNVWATEEAGTPTGQNTGLPTTSTTTNPLTFNFPPDFSQIDPRQRQFQQFATTNLFYWNNIIHDLTYIYGFNENAANFQTNNQGRGRQGNDNVIALAQSSQGGAIGNNANFSTPPDGSRPRMRMYIFGNPATTKIRVNSPASIAADYNGNQSLFSLNNNLLGNITAQAIYFNDTIGTHLACSGGPTTSLVGKIALIDRGTCSFVLKVKEAQNAGAIAAIVINNVPGLFTMGPSAAQNQAGSDNTITIPAFSISQADGNLIAEQIANNLNITLMGGGLDGDLDNGIIAHEFGHGVSNRLTGGGSVTSCLQNAEQGGEGWSDYLGLMLTTNWASTPLTDGTRARGIGTYAIGEPTTGPGFRPAPYSTNLAINSLTYANMGTNPYNNGVAGTSPHAIGTIWCTALWEMTWAIIQQEGSINPNLYNFSPTTTGGNSVALKLVLEGMKLQPCSPGFIDARNAILAADRNLYCGKYSCAIWTAFAKRGMGFSANQGISGSTSDQTAFTDLPPAPTINSQPMDVSAMIGANATFTANAGSDVNLIYQWQVSTNNGTTWTNIDCSILPTLTLTSVTGTMNGYKYRAQVFIGCAITTTSVATLTVTGAPAPSITLSSAPSTSNQTVCINAPIVNITYTTAGGVTGATVTGLPTGVTGSYSAGVFTINGTPTLTGTFSYTVTTSGGTPNATASGTILVNAATTVVLTSAPGTTFQTVTLSSSINNITYTSTGGVTNITASGLPSGVTGTYSGGTNGTFTISGTPTVTGTFSYTVTSSGGCGVSTATGSITVVNGPSISLSSSAGTNNQTLCVNTSITSISYTTSGGVTGATVTGLPSGVTGSYSGGTNGTFTITGTPSVTGLFNYTINTTGGSATATTTGSINVNPLVNVTLTSAAGTTAQTVNLNSPISNITYSTVGGVTGATVTGLPSGVLGTYSGGVNGNITISGTPSVSGTFNYTVTTAGGCGTQTRTGSITVVTPPSITLTSAASTSNQTICLANPIVNITYATAGGVLGATITGLPAGVTGNYSGGTNGTFNISGTPSASGTFNYTITTSGGSPVSTTGSITVNIPPSAPIVSGNVTYCQGATATALTANGVGLLWYTVAAGGTGTTVAPVPSTITVGTTIFYVSQTTNGCEGARASISVTVNPTPSAPSVVSTVNYCQGATNATPLSATGSNLKWYTVATGGTSTTTAPTPSTATAGTTVFYVSQTTGTCESPRAAITVTVSAGPAITVQPLDITSCTTTASFSVTASGTNLTYQWQVSTDGGSTFGNIVGATNSTYIISGLLPAQANNRYRVIVSAAGCSSATSNAVTARVGTAPSVVLSAVPSVSFNPSVNGSLFVTVNPTGNYTYQWKRNNNILPLVTSTSITKANGLLDEFGTYQVTVTDVNTGCSGVSNTVTVSDIVSERSRLFISPNPTRGMLRVSYYSNSTAAQTRMISLYDSKGAQLLTKTFNVAGTYGFMDLNLTNFVSGTYMLILRDAAGNKIASESVIKY